MLFVILCGNPATCTMGPIAAAVTQTHTRTHTHNDTHKPHRSLSFATSNFSCLHTACAPYVMNIKCGMKLALMIRYSLCNPMKDPEERRRQPQEGLLQPASVTLLCRVTPTIMANFDHTGRKLKASSCFFFYFKQSQSARQTYFPQNA